MLPICNAPVMQTTILHTHIFQVYHDYCYDSLSKILRIPLIIIIIIIIWGFHNHQFYSRCFSEYLLFSLFFLPFSLIMPCCLFSVPAFLKSWITSFLFLYYLAIQFVEQMEVYIYCFYDLPVWWFRWPFAIWKVKGGEFVIARHRKRWIHAPEPNGTLSSRAEIDCTR